MSAFVVVDASVAFKWLVEEEDSDNATDLARFWDDEGFQPAAPYLMLFEVANVLHRRAMRGDLEVEAAVSLMQDLLSVGVEFYHPAGLHARVLESASLLRQGAAYDARYPALAETLDCEFWTADERFYRVAVPVARYVRWIGEFAAQG